MRTLWKRVEHGLCSTNPAVPTALRHCATRWGVDRARRVLKTAGSRSEFGGGLSRFHQLFLDIRVLELLNSDPASIDRASLLELLSSSERVFGRAGRWRTYNPSCTRGGGRAGNGRDYQRGGGTNARNLFRRSPGYADVDEDIGSDGSRAFALRGRCAVVGYQSRLQWIRPGRAIRMRVNPRASFRRENQGIRRNAELRCVRQSRDRRRDGRSYRP